MNRLKKIIIIVILLLAINFIQFQVLAVTSTTTQPISNGIYEIEWVSNNNKVLDISGAETRAGANVQIWDKCNGKQQRFQFIYQNDGFYVIKNINSGKVLDVQSAGKQSGTNVWQWTSNSTDAQKWKLEKNADGSISIISKCNNLYLSVTGAKNSNGANIEVNSKKQSFNLKKVTTINGTKTINDGYTLHRDASLQ